MGEARVLFYDVETSPNIGYTWGKWQQDVIQFSQEWHLLSFAWKWQGEKKVQVLGLDDWPRDFKKDPTDDRQLAWNLHQLMDEAHVTIAHNGDRFDMRKARARFVLHGFPPASPVRQVDTLKIARKEFMFNSNKLGDLGQILGIGSKEATGGFRTWLGCMAGDPKAWARMKKYNKTDVALLEKVYDKIMPYASSLPNLALIKGVPQACPKCGHVGKMMARGFRHYTASRAGIFQCMHCANYSSLRLSDKFRPTYK